jgi:hypothetical protein
MRPPLYQGIGIKINLTQYRSEAITMPSRRFHTAVDRLFLGRSFPEVHRALDSPSQRLGTRHRALFHDPLSAVLVGRSIAGDEGALSAFLHVITDWSSSSLRRLLRTLASTSRRSRT